MRSERMRNEAAKARPNVARSDLAVPEPARLMLSLQSSAGNRAVAGLVQRRQNKTGLPDHLKAGIESLSGVSLDDVEVHYNSSRPAHLGANAFAQGSDIHIAPGRERHLPHEAWHVVQQAQGRVSPSVQLGDVGINTNTALEREADEMGAKASRQSVSRVARKGSSAPTVQCDFALRVGAFMVVVRDSAIRHLGQNAIRAVITDRAFEQAIAGQYQGQQVNNFHVRAGGAHLIVNIYPAGTDPAVVEVFHADDGYKEENRRKMQERFYGSGGDGSGTGSFVGAH